MTRDPGTKSADNGAEPVDFVEPTQNPAPAFNPPSRVERLKSRKTRVGYRQERPRITAYALRQARSAFEVLNHVKRLNRRTRAGKAVTQWENQFIDAMGGPDVLSPQLETVCRMAARTRLLLEVVDGFIATMESPIHRGKRALWPVIMQRQVLADALLRQLQAMGLERRAKRVPSVREYLASRTANQSAESPA